jgi:hypothetical protein
MNTLLTVVLIVVALVLWRFTHGFWRWPTLLAMGAVLVAGTAGSTLQVAAVCALFVSWAAWMVSMIVGIVRDSGAPPNDKLVFRAKCDGCGWQDVAVLDMDTIDEAIEAADRLRGAGKRGGKVRVLATSLALAAGAGACAPAPPPHRWMDAAQVETAVRAAGLGPDFCMISNNPTWSPATATSTTGYGSCLTNVEGDTIRCSTVMTSPAAAMSTCKRGARTAWLKWRDGSSTTWTRNFGTARSGTVA